MASLHVSTSPWPHVDCIRKVHGEALLFNRSTSPSTLIQCRKNDTRPAEFLEKGGDIYKSKGRFVSFGEAHRKLVRQEFYADDTEVVCHDGSGGNDSGINSGSGGSGDGHDSGSGSGPDSHYDGAAFICIHVFCRYINAYSEKYSKNNRDSSITCKKEAADTYGKCDKTYIGIGNFSDVEEMDFVNQHSAMSGISGRCLREYASMSMAISNIQKDLSNNHMIASAGNFCTMICDTCWQLLHFGSNALQASLNRIAFLQDESDGESYWQAQAEGQENGKAFDLKDLIAESLNEMQLLSYQIINMNSIQPFKLQVKKNKEQTSSVTKNRSSQDGRMLGRYTKFQKWLAKPFIQTSNETPEKREGAQQLESKDQAGGHNAPASSPSLDTHNVSGFAKQSDIEILKRLQREVFSELMKLREKLEKIHQARTKTDLSKAHRTRLRGEVNTGMAFVLLEDGISREARDSLVCSGLQTGVNVKLTFETPFRKKDMLITQFSSGQGSSVGDGRALGGPIRLGKLHYTMHVSDDIALSFVPLGAQGKDMTEIINVLQDEGLTAFSSQGPALFNCCKGSSVGATVSGSKFAFSVAQYLSGWDISVPPSLAEGGDPLCLSTLGHLLIQPIEGFIISLAGLNRFWPTPPLPSSMGLHWSEMGPLVIPNFRTSRSRVRSADSHLHKKNSSYSWETPELEYGASVLEPIGSSHFSLALSSSIDLTDNLSISAWTQLERGDSLQDLHNGNLQWAVSLAKSSVNGIGWGASIGSSLPDLWTVSSSNVSFPGCRGDDGDSQQLQMEAFLKIKCGEGLTLQPGVLYVSNKNCQSHAFVIRGRLSL